MHKGDIGFAVASLQRQLIAVGFKINPDAVFGPATEAAVIAFQKRVGLVADGVVGPKTQAALLDGDRNKRLLSEADLEQAAARLDVPLAAIKAVNTVESNGHGFLADGRAVILYERHIMYRRLEELGEPAADLAARYPNLVNLQRGGYAGGSAERARLTSAIGIHRTAALESCSWGQFQVMGYHWSALAYESIFTFVAAMETGEAAQLDAFCRFIEADPALLKALRGRKWADFARLYNGPAYKENLYDVKLARAFERYSQTTDKAAS